MKSCFLAEQKLLKLWADNLVKIKFLPDPFKKGTVPPRAYYYLTDYGWEIYENQSKANRTSIKQCPDWKPRSLTYRARTKAL